MAAKNVQIVWEKMKEEFKNLEELIGGDISLMYELDAKIYALYPFTTLNTELSLAQIAQDSQEIINLINSKREEY
jgi:hypothetical protein